MTLLGSTTKLLSAGPIEHFSYTLKSKLLLIISYNKPTQKVGKEYKILISIINGDQIFYTHRNLQFTLSSNHIIINVYSFDDQKSA